MEKLVDLDTLYATDFSVVSSTSIRCFADNTLPPELFQEKIEGKKEIFKLRWSK